MIKYVLFFMFILSYHISACSCLSEPSVKDSFIYSHYIFVGKIVAKRTILYRWTDYFPKYDTTKRGNSVFKKEYEYDFLVQRFFKGSYNNDVDSIIKVTTGLGGGDCGFPFRFGNDYIVYANFENSIKSPNTYILKTTICTRTCSYDEEEIEELEKEIEALH